MKMRLENSARPKLKKDGKPYKDGRLEYDCVDVCEASCLEKECFHLFRDQGSFQPGRGYTRYHAESRWVCGTRHLHGCPGLNHEFSQGEGSK
jgi:hypothetical protein